MFQERMTDGHRDCSEGAVTMKQPLTRLASELSEIWHMED